MKDNELIAAIIYAIKKYLPAFGVKNFLVSRNAQLSDQFTSSGIDSEIKTRIFVHQVAHKLVQNAPTVTVKGGKKILTTNRAVVINISVLKFVDTNDINDYTPDDIAEIISDMFFDLDVIMDLRKKQVRIENRSGIKPKFFINDSDRYEFLASFDLGVTYESSRVFDLNVVDERVVARIKTYRD